MSHTNKPRRVALARIDALTLLTLAAVLLTLALPAVRNARLHAQQAQGTKTLFNLVRELHNFTSVYNGDMPPGVGPFRKRVGTLHYHLLPFLNQTVVWKANATDAVIPVFLDEADPSAPRDNLFEGKWPTANYAANWLVFKHGPKAGGRLPATFRDGTSNTLVFAERYQVCNGTPMVWSHDQLTHRAPLFALFHQGKFQVTPKQDDCDPALPQGLTGKGLQVAFGDGTVRTLAPTISHTTWWRLCHPDDGQAIANDF